MKSGLLALLVALSAGCASHWPPEVCGRGFRSRWIERELDFYVANFSAHATNTFYVVPTKTKHGDLVEALVYWPEERTILLYEELPRDAFINPSIHEELYAWWEDTRHCNLKLDRDTVDTPAEVAQSPYAITHHQWVTSMEQCMSKGKRYLVTMEAAKKRYPRRVAAEREK